MSMLRMLSAVLSSLAFALVGLAAPPASAALIVKVQPIQVCNDAGAACATVGYFEAETDKIWAQAGIDIMFLSTVYQLDETDYLSIDSSTGGAGSEIDNLFTAGNALAGDPYTTLAINMYFVDEITPAITYGLGCGASIYAAFCANKAGVIIAGTVFSANGGAGRRDTIAHELGHVLALTHDDYGAGCANDTEKSNLMTQGSCRFVPSGIGDIAPDGLNYSQLTTSQIDVALRSDFVQQVPEPPVVMLLAASLIGYLGYGRQRRRKPAH